MKNKDQITAKKIYDRLRQSISMYVGRNHTFDLNDLSLHFTYCKIVEETLIDNINSLYFWQVIERRRLLNEIKEIRYIHIDQVNNLLNVAENINDQYKKEVLRNAEDFVKAYKKQQ